jgi:NAD(P)H dehydrogenase (quinone)
MIIGITGASGKVGRYAAQYAVQQFPAEQIVLLTRTPQSLQSFSDAGVEVRAADFDATDGLRSAFAGITHLMVISASNFTGKRTDQHGAAFDAARDAGVEKVVFLSMPGVEDPENPIGLSAHEYRDAELHLINSGMRWTILRNGPYTELHVVERLGADLSEKNIYSNAQEGRAGFVSRRDVAEGAIGALTLDNADERIFAVSGPEMLSFRDITSLLADATGHELNYVEVGDEEFESRLRAQGYPELGVESLTGMGKALRAGYFDDGSDAVQELTGRPAVSVADVLQANRRMLDVAENCEQGVSP